MQLEKKTTMLDSLDEKYLHGELEANNSNRLSSKVQKEIVQIN